jgi:hypothetical protein
MVAILSTFVIIGFALATLYAGLATLIQYGHLIGPAWRMEGAQPRGTLVSMRSERQPVLARSGPSRPAPKASHRHAPRFPLRIAA